MTVSMDGAWRSEVDEPVGVVVECAGCWFPGGAPVAAAAVAADVAGRHDAAAHDGIPTARVTPRWETSELAAGACTAGVLAMASGTGAHR